MSATSANAARSQTLSDDVMAVVRASSAARQSVVGRVFSDLVARVRTVIAARRAEAELSALDDRLLADIGITRGDIPGVLNSANSNDHNTRVA